MKTITKLLAIVMILGLVFTALPSSAVSAEPVGANPAMQEGADRLTALQNTDGGWDWELDDGTPASVSPVNTIGPIGMGLAQAYRYTGDADHRVALQKVGNFLLAKTNNFSPSDGYLAAQLDVVFSGSTYKTHLVNYYYGPLAVGNYDRNGAGTLYNTATYVAALRAYRSGDQANMAAWDIGMGLVGAASCGVTGNELGYWIDGVKAEINELSGGESKDNYLAYDVIGLAGAVYGLAKAGVSFDPTAGEHAAASSTADLAAILASYQINNGGFAWNKWWVFPNDNDEVIQETAYAILALNEVNRAEYLDEIRGAADYMLSVQLANGGWYNDEYWGKENNETTAEALWGIATAYPYPEVWVCGLGDCGHPGFAFNTIQSGINAVDPGGIVHVAAGTYDEENILITKGLTLQGAGAETTFIAPTTEVGDNSIIVVKNPTGDVLIDGFTFTENVKGEENIGYAVVVTGKSIAVDSATVTISHNVIDGSQDGGWGRDFGFYGQTNNAKLIINNNVINKTGSNSICMENQMGSTIVSNNTIYISNDVYYDAYFSMAHSGANVTTPQIVENNIFHLDHSGDGYSQAITFDTAVLNSWNSIPTDTGHYEDIQIKNNLIYTEGAMARGIGLVDLSSADGMGTISGAVISGNQIIGENPTDADTFGITLSGDIEGALIENNSISNVKLGMRVIAGSKNAIFPSGTDVNKNQIVLTGTAISNPGTATLDASPNWFGSIAGPGAAQISGDVDFTPWCEDENCTFTVPNEEGEIELPPDADAEGVQNAINNAPEGTTIIIPDGTYGQTGAFVIDTPHLTIQLADGTVIQNSSPCFNITASYTTITAEPGAVCKPTGDSNGIDVATGLVNIIIEGLEIDGSEQVPLTSGVYPDGINFAGAVTDLVLRDNFIHNLGGDGVEFVGQPTGTIDIQGNLFQNNGELGIDASSFAVLAEYNSWGSASGAAAGDGISSSVDADPFTHVDLYLVSSGTPWANQVVTGQTITYTVKANMKNVNAADFVLKYDSELLSIASVTTGSDFVGIYTDDNPETQQPLVNTSVAGEIRFTGFKLIGTVSGDVTLYTVIFDTLKADTGDLTFDEATDGFGMPGVGSSSNIYAAALTDGSVKVIELPTLTSTDIQGYYLTGEARDFHVTVTNPVDGGNFVNSIYYVFTIHDAELTDLNSLTCNFTGEPTDIKALMAQSDTDLIGRVGYLSAGFPMAAGFSTTTTCTANFVTSGSYAFDVAMVDNTTANPSNDYTLFALNSTAVVYNKPVITQTGLTGNHLGLTVPFTLNINNMSAMSQVPFADPLVPITFQVNLGLPAGTVLTYPVGAGTANVTCTSAGCSFPVTLNAGSNAISLSAAFTGTQTVTTVPASLYDSLANPDRLLASASFGPVAVYNNITPVLGTVSMQGRSARAGVPMTLTAVSVPFGPYTATSIEQISNNLSFANVAEATYTITTNQPRYLNVTADLLKTAAISTSKTSLAKLELKGGNAIYTDNKINIQDAACVGSQFGATGDGDVNFDGKINVQDLALVGGNYGKTSATAYLDWVP